MKSKIKKRNLNNQLKNVEFIIKNANEYYKNTKSTTRYQSWEHCYKLFYSVIKKKHKKDIDCLALNLAFYLASWGMYRGSSFLLQFDYTVHCDAVRKILKYKKLCDISCGELKEEKNLNMLFQLEGELQECYIDKKAKVATKGNNKITDTLITKILLGTLGCVPAYDTYFKKRLKSTGIAGQTFNEDSIKGMCTFYQTNEAKLEVLRKKFKIGSIPYPQMKLIDMGLWTES